MVEIGIVSVCGNTMCYLNYREAEVQEILLKELHLQTSSFSWRRLEHANRNVEKNPWSPHGSPWTIFLT